MTEEIYTTETDFGYLYSSLKNSYEPHICQKMLSKSDVNMGLKEIDGYGLVTVIHSTCPNCDHVNEWSTTGMLPGHITCKKCDEKFNVNMP
jgi:hypothetical protein